jgi:protein-S-isoprenylcysteine O-methyltransferase Ste14
MISNQTAVPVVTQDSTPALFRVLMNPWLDRTIAAIACLPILYMVYYRYHHWGLGLPLITFSIGMMILIATMIFRRPPKRITPNPWYWLLAFVASYWGFMTLGVMQRGYPLVSRGVSDAVAICGLLIIVWARLSLGRNIGFVPAQREIVTSGAYKYVRHPIYTGAFVGFLGIALRAYSPRNVVLLGLGTFWFLIKSIVEENFLRADPQYVAYMQRVRVRWIPFVV